MVWITKYRYQVLGGDVSQRCRELIRETARAHEMVIQAGSVNRDPVHLLVSIPPSLSVSRAVQHLKVGSSHKLLSEFAVMKKRYWGQYLWARGYWGCTSGNVTDEMWIDYIPNQTRLTPTTTLASPESSERRTDPAFSRNLKAPAFRRWSIHP